MKRGNVVASLTKDKNISQIENDNFLSFKEYATILKYQKYTQSGEILLNSKLLKAKMQKLIPSIMPHKMDIKSDYKIRNEL